MLKNIRYQLFFIFFIFIYMKYEDFDSNYFTNVLLLFLYVIEIRIKYWIIRKVNLTKIYHCFIIFFRINIMEYF